TWYVPFAPAPVVEFEMDESSTSGEPSGDFAIAWATASKRGDAGLNSNGWGWANRMNYYDWGANRSTCSNDSSTYTYYVPMDWGLGEGVFANYNSDTRMEAVKNTIPSACAGRPLLLANEPEGLGQANMSFP